MTTLLDHVTHPAGHIAAAYAQRWQAEVAYLNLKVTLRGAGTRLRGQTPHLARARTSHYRRRGHNEHRSSSS